MKLANRVLELIEKKERKAYQAEIDAFQELLQNNGVSGFDVNVEKDGKDYFVTLSDGKDEETLLFGVDEEDDAYCMSLDDGDVLDDFADCLDLQPANPSFLEDGSLDMTDLSWINQSNFAMLFDADEEVVEKMKTVIRKGKKVRIIVRTKKKRLTTKQKAARAKRKGKRVTQASLRKRAASLKIRKQAGL